MSDTPDYSDDLLETGRLLFAAEVTFLLGVVELKGLPPGDRPEIAFAGPWAEFSRRRERTQAQAATRAPKSPWKSAVPSSPPRAGSAARSGWGIIPKTRRLGESTPAMSLAEPLGLSR